MSGSPYLRQSRRGCGRCRLRLNGDFRDAEASGSVEGFDGFAKSRVAVAVDEDLRFRVLREEVFQRELQLGGRDKLLVKKHFALFSERYAGEVFAVLRQRGCSDGQVHRDAFVFYHRKRHHDERREQEKDDVDERDDLDAGVLLGTG